MDADEGRYIYRASIRLRNGKRIYAWQYGLKAFRIRVAPPPEEPSEA
jgi:hypothetical protein